MDGEAKVVSHQFKRQDFILKASLLIITAGLMLHLNWRLQHLSLGVNCETSCNQDDIVSCSQNGEVITKSSVREIGKPLTRKVFLTIGIPTVQRTFQNKTKSYLVETLNSLLTNSISEEDLEDILIVIFLADTEESARMNVKQETAVQLCQIFRNECNSRHFGTIFVLSSSKRT
ncbi:Alpha-1,3-mannosyl-glycoprotein 4-beta-N-acetylglucosaminyltransferase C [Desmophyllum pertusum]|uniref:Alpha-1,3-mannosyl-glycoprotein 4-beta-N-acetylglucosaminyltransferase C n=1 Tax=Desmophyllum pertusum TaxID=174260 RepID=A0A9W9YBV1_9CNID|nr:Alpha-1,3-mannosyl-glycoprotein 4-beta-N-acetylglucosaminyltransferase C [Desmophyllum pertusum]